MGSLWHSYAKIIELLFGLVSGVGQDISVLDGGPYPQGEGEVFGGFLPHWLQWRF